MPVVNSKGAPTAPVSVSATTTATLLLAANTSRSTATFVNVGAADVYLGTAAVTAAAGIKVPVGSSLRDVSTVAAWYGITASGTADVRVVEVVYP